MAGGGFKVKQRTVGHRHHAGGVVDSKAAACVVSQAVGDDLAARIGIAGQSGHAHHRAVGGVLGHRVGVAVGVGWADHRVVVHVAHSDAERGAAGRAIRAGGQHRDGVAGGGFVVQRTRNCHHAGGAVDGELAASAVGQAVADGLSTGIGVGGQGGHAHGGADGGVLSHRVGGAVGVGWADHRIVVHVGDAQYHGLAAAQATTVGVHHIEAVA